MRPEAVFTASEVLTTFMNNEKRRYDASQKNMV